MKEALIKELGEFKSESNIERLIESIDRLHEVYGLNKGDAFDEVINVFNTAKSEYGE
jgi:hypothetical protein